MVRSNQKKVILSHSCDNFRQALIKLMQAITVTMSIATVSVRASKSTKFVKENPFSNSARPMVFNNVSIPWLFDLLWPMSWLIPAPLKISFILPTAYVSMPASFNLSKTVGAKWRYGQVTTICRTSEVTWFTHIRTSNDTT